MNQRRKNLRAEKDKLFDLMSNGTVVQATLAALFYEYMFSEGKSKPRGPIVAVDTPRLPPPTIPASE